MAKEADPRTANCVIVQWCLTYPAMWDRSVGASMTLNAGFGHGVTLHTCSIPSCSWIQCMGSGQCTRQCHPDYMALQALQIWQYRSGSSITCHDTGHNLTLQLLPQPPNFQMCSVPTDWIMWPCGLNLACGPEVENHYFSVFLNGIVIVLVHSSCCLYIELRQTSVCTDA